MTVLMCFTQAADWIRQIRVFCTTWVIRRLDIPARLIHRHILESKACVFNEDNLGFIFSISVRNKCVLTLRLRSRCILLHSFKASNCSESMGWVWISLTRKLEEPGRCFYVITSNLCRVFFHSLIVEGVTSYFLATPLTLPGLSYASSYTFLLKLSEYFRLACIDLFGIFRWSFQLILDSKLIVFRANNRRMLSFGFKETRC